MLSSENTYLFKFAWLSIRRNAGRSAFIGFSVSLAVIIAIWVAAFFEGMNAQIEQAVVSTNMGFFQLQDPQYAHSTDSSSPGTLTPALIRKLRTPEITSFSPELVLDGNISTPEGAAGLMVLGIIPKLHKSTFSVEKNIIAGSFITDDDTVSVIIGKELADIFKLSTGDQMVLNYQDQQGGLRSEILNVKGIYKYSSKSFEKKYVYISQAHWQKLYLREPVRDVLFNRIILMTDDLGVESKISALAAGTDMKLKSWKQLNPEMAVILEFHDGMIKFFFLIIGVTITITILTPVKMLWQERVKELKMMNTLGVTSNKFWKIGVFEVFLMILLSAGFSSIMLLALIGTQSYTGVNMSFLNDGVSIERAGIKLPGIIYPLLSPGQILSTIVFVVFVLSISYLWSIFSTLKQIESTQ